MSFDPNNNKIKQALSTTNSDDNKETTNKDKLVIPEFVDESERTKNYTFTLQPSVRKQLDALAREHKFKSASKFLNELIKNM